ncbi:hypothetical protein [Acetobacter musti]|uniref:hypothetical protein n=1 Tax=Acetobacter musti TaxID=864732 RepID=UPI00156B95F4|nr:hypothetical protein [Acetobacter musti]
MTHLPYIVASYGLAIGLATFLSVGAAVRLRRDRVRLATLEAARGGDRRSAREETV